MTASGTIFRPPAPTPLSPLMGLIRCIREGDGDLLSLLPKEAYEVDIGSLGYSRRSIVIVNAPDLTKRIMTEAVSLFPKNDLMKGALAPLVGESIFVSDGAAWERQRRMVEPAFSFMRIGNAFAAMRSAVDAFVETTRERAASGTPLSLDFAMSHLTADIICRTVFSTSLQSGVARDVFESFALFERSVSNVKLSRLIFGKAWSDVKQTDEVLAACARIRRQMGVLLDDCQHSARDTDNIAHAVIEARDPENGDRFDREELIDQLGVFFLAGHETTASVLTWAFYILSVVPDVAARIRAEVDDVVGDRPIDFSDIKGLAYTRNVFRETLRLYPPLTFIPRVAAEACELGGRRIKKGAMVMIAPWTIHRHRRYWRDPERFDPDRFSPERESEIVRGTYIPFGQGPRVCTGATFAQIESALILATLVRAFDFDVIDPEKVQPAARLTTRPKAEIMCRVRSR